MDNNTLAAPVIEVTQDYDVFKFMSNNREQYKGQIQNLKNAIEEFGNISRTQPVLVNEQMQIIDGQHRYVALKELDMPVYFMVGDGMGIRDSRSMNILHKSWTADDFAHSYADSGDASYVRYLQLREEYGFGHSVTMAAITGAQASGQHKQFREGNFTLTPEMEEGARQRLALMSAAQEVSSIAGQREFAIALIYASLVPGFEAKRMITKLQQYESLIVRHARATDYQRMLEEIYNRNVVETNRVRLF